MPDWNGFVRAHLPGTGLRREREEEIVADLAQQLEDWYREALAGGASEKEAEELARRQVPDWKALAHDIAGSRAGSRQAAIDRWYEQAEAAAHSLEFRCGRPARLWADLRHDLLYGIRMLMKHRGFTATALITLAFGIGINIAVFTVVHAMMNIPRTYPDAGSLVFLWGTKNPDILHGLFSVPEALDYQSRSGSFSEFGTYRSVTKAWRSEAETERIQCLETTASLLPMVGVAPVLGRWFPVSENSAAEPVAVVSDKFWRTKLGADPKIVGKTYAIDGVFHTIIGVLEPTRKLMQLGHFDIDVLTPLSRDAAREPRKERSCQVLARFRQGVSHESAQTELNAIAAGLARANPETNAGRGIRLQALADQLVRPNDRLMGLMLIVAVTAVLLVVCLNLANMLIAKATNRTREFAIRLALGAGRMRIVRQLITESLLLAASGGALGWWLAHGALRIFLQMMPGMEDAPFTWQELGPDGSVLLYTLAISLATSAVFGLAPAAMLSRIPIADAVKEAGAGGMPARNRLRHALVVAELAIGLPILICCGLAVRNVFRLSTIDLGFESRNLLTMYVELPRFRYTEKAQWLAAFQIVEARLQTLRGAQGAGAALSFPVGSTHYRMAARVRVEGMPAQGADSYPYLHLQPVTPGYFKTMGIPLLSGRWFGQQDRQESAAVAIINRRMASVYFPGSAAVGRSVILDPGSAGERRVTIVGVAGDSGRGILGEPVAPEMYLPYAQNPMPAMVVVIRSTGDPMQLVPDLRRSMRDLDPDIPVAELQTVPEIVHRWLRDDQMGAVFLAILAALSLALAGLGLFGVMSFAVSRRTHEIGVRVALGADAGCIRRLVLRQCLKLTLKGLGIGFIFALPAALLLGSEFHGVGGMDPVAFAGVSALLLAVGLLAGYIPARHATQVDPIQALRHE